MRHKEKRPDGSGARAARCAIYTRKSHEEGLEQDFNSLDAQREACEAFILSQKHAGWRALPTFYDDGGVSGATMERPALERLLTDIAARKVDVVVVYKVDRLTRSLSDFAKMVDIFDAQDVSFVSVTQQFNTTTSMGRLTLNVLLSFAQFEREVTGERIRDKIAASKKKGMWMGGLPPLGYDVKDRKLVVNEAEAETVRHIFRRYAEVGSVRLLKRELDAGGIESKPRIGSNGNRYGAKPHARGALYWMLKNRIYRGEIVHRDKSYPGDHAAIIEQDLWEKVQQRLLESRIVRVLGTNTEAPSLLAGLLYDEDGSRLTPTHAVKGGRRYRYYVSSTLVTGARSDVPNGRRIPAGDIEALVTDRIRGFLLDEAAIHGAIEPYASDASRQQWLIKRAKSLSASQSQASPASLRAPFTSLIARIDLKADRIDIRVDPARLIAHLAGDQPNCAGTTNVIEAKTLLTLSIRARLRRTGLQTKMIIDGGRSGHCDVGMLRLLVKAHEFRHKLFNSDADSISSFAREQRVTGSYATRLIRLSFLAPDILRDILDGRHPITLNAAKLIKNSRLPLHWNEQRAVLGFL